MGLYNTYWDGQLGVQLKVAEELQCLNFNVGDEADIPDGVYCGYDGVVVVKNGILVGCFDKLTTTWGDELNPTKIVDPLNPMYDIIEVFKKSIPHPPETKP